MIEYSDLLELLRTEGRGTVDVVIIESVPVLQPLELISNDAAKCGPWKHLTVV